MYVLCTQSALPLTEQLEDFKEYIEKVKNIVGEERANFILRNSIYFVVAGSDDIANTYFGTPFRRSHYDVNSYTDLMLHSATSFVQVFFAIFLLYFIVDRASIIVPVVIICQ